MMYERNGSFIIGIVYFSVYFITFLFILIYCGYITYKNNENKKLIKKLKNDYH